VFRMSRCATVLLPLLLVLGLAPAPAQASTISASHATFRGWVNAAKTGGATYDPRQGDNYRLTGDCEAFGNTHGVSKCAVYWTLFYDTPYTLCTTSTESGWVGSATYWPDEVADRITAKLFAVGAPGAATFEGWIPDVTGIVLHIKIDAAAACAALSLLKADPYANTSPHGFTGTVDYGRLG